MNLLDRIKPGLVTLLIPVFFACQNDDSDLQIEIEGGTNVSYIEFDLPTTNQIIDSLRTNLEGTITVGNYLHTHFGTVAAKSFSHFSYDSGFFISDTMEFVSMRVDLRISNFRTNSQNEEISWVFKPFRGEIFTGGQAVYLAHKDIPVFGFQLDSVREEINLSDTVVSFETPLVGERVFDQLSGMSQSEILSYIGNLAFLPTAGNQSLASFDLLSPDTQISMFSKDKRDSIYETRFLFTGAQFSNITRDRTGSSIDNRPNLDTFNISSEYAVLDPVFGIYPVVDFGEVQSFIVSNPNLVVNRANLSFDLTPETNNGVKNVNYYYWKPNAGIDGIQRLTNALLTGIVSNTAYIDVATRNVSPTSLLNTPLSENKYQSDVLLFADDYYYSYYRNDSFYMDRIVVTSRRVLSIGESRLSKNGAKLKIYYTSVK